mgnify:CR=1 FL=1
MARSKAILIVDDNPQYTLLLRRILGNGFGYRNITAAETTEEAYRLIAESPHRYQLVFVDYRFPEGTTGGELLARLKRENLMESRVAFLVTSEPTVDNQREALNAGARGVVAKPFTRDCIEQQLQKVERLLKLDTHDQF